MGVRDSFQEKWYQSRHLCEEAVLVKLSENMDESWESEESEGTDKCLEAKRDQHVWRTTGGSEQLDHRGWGGGSMW